MRTFATLYAALDQTTSSNDKVEAMTGFFRNAPPADAIWAAALLSGRRPKRPVRTTDLHTWAANRADIPLWLFEESYAVVGDLSETISLLVATDPQPNEKALSVVMAEVIAIAGADEKEKKRWLYDSWNILSKEELFVFNKLITGSFRVGVSTKLVHKAIAAAFQVHERVVAHRLMGQWSPQENDLPKLLSGKGDTHDAQPYPFYLAYQLDVPFADLGEVKDWVIEKKYDGIRGQLIARNGEVHTWSRGEELMTEKFVEFHALREMLPDGTVLDGEILPVKDGKILPFSEMQKRIGRKNLNKKMLAEIPLCMICYDLLEWKGEDIREKPLHERRTALESLLKNLNSPLLRLSPAVDVSSWEDVYLQRERSRAMGCEGLMLKHRDSVYETGRRRGKWWKWKVDPYTVDAVLLYAQPGRGRRANLYTDYTFAVWDGSSLVPFAKAYSGLTDQEIREVDSWIKKNTVEKFGPVRSVKPQLVFELAFEGIQSSPRHKSGIALRFPRIQQWRRDKKSEEANTKSDLLQLLHAVNR